MARPRRGGGDPGESEDASGSIPAHLRNQAQRVQCDLDAPKNTHSGLYCGTFAGVGGDIGWTQGRFERSFSVEIQSLRGGDLVFDLVGLEPAIANALRRILIAEVPTMAIEKVFIADNTSLIADEILAHRLGLVPLSVDPRLFDYLPPDGLANEGNTIVFRLKHKCTRSSGQVEGAHVRSGMLEWMPGGSEYPPGQPQQKFTTFGAAQDTLHDFARNSPAPTYPDIVLAKLRPGQAIELEAHAVKGIAKTHAKWSPVATATYRMLPQVELLRPVEGEEAQELAAVCPMKVFDMEDGPQGMKRVTVARPRECTLCRECLRSERWGEAVRLTREKQHFIFSIESTGSLPPGQLFMEAVKVLREKASSLLAELS